MRSQKEIIKKINELVNNEDNFLTSDWVWNGEDEIEESVFSKNNTIHTLTDFANWVKESDMDIEAMEKKMNDYFNSEECKTDIDKFITENKRKDLILNSQLERFHIKYRLILDDTIEEIINKYHSDKYVNRWYNRNIEPPEDLYWFLFEYAKKYGEEIEESEHYNMFTDKGYQIGNWLIQQINGQGSFILIHKLENEEHLHKNQ